MIFTEDKPGILTTHIECIECHKTYELNIPVQHWLEYQCGAHPQHALKTLDAGQRELIISQICGPCFDAIFEELKPKRRNKQCQPSKNI